MGRIAMMLRDKLRLLMRDYTVSDILFSLGVIFREDAIAYFDRRELISANENIIIADALAVAGSRIAFMPQYGISSTPEPVDVNVKGAENVSQRVDRGFVTTKRGRS